MPSEAEKELALAEYYEKIRNARVRLQTEFDKNERKEVDIKNFTALSVIGSGGFGSVYKASTNGQGPYAVKVQKKSFIRKYGLQKEIILERKLMAYMDSPFVMELLSHFKDADNLYLVMPLARYGDLYKMLKRSGAVPEARAVKIIIQVVLALEYCHACSLIHRDLKPHNILIFERGRVKISDFGCCVRSDGQVFGMAGTSLYRAPEMLKGDYYTEAVDWWSLGVIIHQVLLLELPFCGKYDPKPLVISSILNASIRTFKSPNYSETAENLVRSLLEKNQANRLGAIKPGASFVKNHDWFKNVDCTS
ncbi:spermatozoon-associated protein kinase-like [Galendromus occidentalis]|uniref:Spermatozoon-associated protein kinase-like n=1 Tax=Galendromus occidentalis TaxID=34638 RepID=A0AAJ6VWA6_9ACAR|nr:spermatozoon-associated protein kinase-like [Galendromus occidentalis]